MHDASAVGMRRARCTAHSASHAQCASTVAIPNTAVRAALSVRKADSVFRAAAGSAYANKVQYADSESWAWARRYAYGYVSGRYNGVVPQLQA